MSENKITVGGLGSDPDMFDPAYGELWQPTTQEDIDTAEYYVLYHADCMDGFGAAWALHNQFKDNATYIPCKYNSPPPVIPDGSFVFIVDFSFSKAELIRLQRRAAGIAVLDHHLPKKQEIGSLPFVIFDEDHSGAVMTWKHMFPDQPVPRLLEVVEDWDLWKFEKPLTREIHAALRSYPMEFDVWYQLDAKLRHNPFSLVSEGQAILRTEEQLVDMICKQATYMDDMLSPLTPDHVKAVMVNATSHWSQVGHRLLELYPEAEYAATVYTLADGREKWSLRSRKGGIDVSEIARNHGGGGHHNAAGFVRDFSDHTV